MKRLSYCLVFSFLIASLFLIFPSFASAQKDLALYLAFDEGSGDVVKDLSPLKLEGKLIKNPKWVDGKFGKALEFGGPASGQYVDIAQNPGLDATNAVTVMAWIRPNAWGNACCDQVFGYGVHGGCGGRVQYGLFQEVDLKARFEAEAGRLDVTTKLPDVKRWSHVAISFEDGVGKIYVDGKMAAENKIDKTILKKSNEPFYVAADCERLNYIFNGAVDELRVFKRALSEKEIAEQMTKGREILGGVAVDVAGKLTTSWGKVKAQF